MLNGLTYFFDIVRITLGDSECPLAKRCSGYDIDGESCVSYRGRDEVRGERAECYRIFKPQIRARKGKEGLLSIISGKIMGGIARAEGIENEDLD